MAFEGASNTTVDLRTRNFKIGGNNLLCVLWLHVSRWWLNLSLWRWRKRESFHFQGPQLNYLGGWKFESLQDSYWIVAWNIGVVGCPNFLSQIKMLSRKFDHGILFLS